MARKTIDLIDIHSHKEKNGFEVCDSGIYYYHGGSGRLVIPRETFIEAFNKYIKEK